MAFTIYNLVHTGQTIKGVIPIKCREKIDYVFDKYDRTNVNGGRLLILYQLSV